MIRKSPVLSFGIEKVDLLFPGFQKENFGVIYGSPEYLWLSLLLCVRSQLPSKDAPQGLPALFLDGGNSFDVYEVSRFAKTFGIPPKKALNSIFISRAFTAYQLTELVFDRLQPAVEKFGAGLVVIANFPWLYLDRDIPKTESMDIFNKLTLFLADFAKINKIIIVATYVLGRPWARTLFYEAALVGRAEVVLKTVKSKSGLNVTLEKHPAFPRGIAETPPKGITLTDFLEA